MKISVVGLGLIGGSFALSLKRRFEDITIYGWDQSSSHLDQATDLGILDHKCESLQEVVKMGDQIILAIPVNAIERILPEVLGMIQEHQLVVDFGSTKEAICQVAADHPKRAQFIAAHPIAGTEYSGPEAAFDTLYEDKVMIVCEEEKANPDLIANFRKQCKAIGMTTTYLGAKEHDVHLAYVSHLSHIISFGLSRTVLQKEESDNKILELAGSGFASTVRLAKSSPEMWTPIFLKNKPAILDSLDSYMDYLQQFRDLLASEDNAAIKSYLEKGREIRKILE